MSTPLRSILAVGLALTTCDISSPAHSAPLSRAAAPLPVSNAVVQTTAAQSTAAFDDRLWSKHNGDRQALLRAIDYSLRYLRTNRAAVAYRRVQAQTGISRSHVQRSLLRFKQLLRYAITRQQFEAALAREFVWYRAAGHDGRGSVAFTGYYRPLVTASRVRTDVYRYPLYRLPGNFARWPSPHPTRAQLEGSDGLHQSRLLRGAELVWLRDRLTAYLIQVQGSAQLRLTDGKTVTIGCAGHTNWPYVSMGRELVKDGSISATELTLPLMIDHFHHAPQDLNRYLPRNRRFVFFHQLRGAGASQAPASGSLGLPLTAERSIATDKSLMPPGALALIQIQVTNPAAAQVLGTSYITRFVLDQDAGGAIKGAGRVDVFMGTGEQAGRRAGVINSPGSLHYLLLKGSS